MNEPRQTQTQTVAIDDEPIIDVKSAANFIGYLTRSMKRRRRLMLTTFVITTFLVAVLTAMTPRSYKISMRIFVHTWWTLQLAH